MKRLIYKSLWGHEGTLDEAIRQAVEAGFDGIEGPVPADIGERDRFGAGMKENGLDWIAEVTTGGGYVPDPSAGPERHLNDLRCGIERSLPLGPRFINTQAGLDAWDGPTQVRFFEAVVAMETELGVAISVETHRSRSTFHPWITRELLRSVPGLRITCDFSHWCCVTERLVMDDDPGLLSELSERCHHVHARVGYDQGPQVPDPRAPEYEREVSSHRRWWSVLWAARLARGCGETTFTPEFGTDGYLHLEPFTRRPVADLWEVNRWMGDQLKQWFGVPEST
ncbi:MAG: sugar phosphate isomerase/epimerase [Verrucomicrobiae bacterium]|nr:sugar phosphate isomerase/epimerase [Verrucomicrobiae bacterium]